MKIILTILLLSISFLKAGNWSNGSPLNVPRAGSAAVTWNGKIYIFGGKSINNNVLNSVEVFDPAVGLWDSSIVQPFEFKRYNTSAIIWNNKIYLIGGRTNDNVIREVEVYDPVQNTWGEVHELRREREGHSTHIFNNRIYTIGGQKEDFNLIEEIEWYDSQDVKWEEAEFDLTNPRAAHFAEVYNDEYYIFGGYYFGLTNNIYKTIPDSSEYTFMEVGTLLESRAYGTTARMDSLIYIIGGETASGKTETVEIYDAKNNIMSPGESLHIAHSGMASAVLDGKIYVIGGFEGAVNDVVNHVHVYDPIITSLSNPIKNPFQHILANAYPNPFNGQVKINIKIPSSDEVKIYIVNTLGQKIRNVENRQLGAGSYSYYWDAKDNSGSYVTSGLYFILIKTQIQNQLLKITYVK